jgi:hypothetical protein
VVIDTVDDVVIGDIGNEIMNTSGVAVRPFWWSKECLQVLGLATGDSGSDTTVAGDTSGSTSSTAAGGSVVTSTGGGDSGTAGGEGPDETGGFKDESASGEGGLSGGWIALICVLAIIAVAALAGLTFMLGTGRRGRGPIGETAGGLATSAEAASTVAAGTAPAFCSQCGSALSSDAKFCARCGRPV